MSLYCSVGRDCLFLASNARGELTGKKLALFPSQLQCLVRPLTATEPSNETARLCRKFLFEAIWGMLSPCDPWCKERESDDGDQFQRCPFR
jgi:hypothetical protein